MLAEVLWKVLYERFPIRGRKNGEATGQWVQL